MQTSKTQERTGTPQGRTRTGRAAGFLLFLAILLGINQLLCFLMEPYRSSSEEMWYGYEARAEENPPDTIIVGTSQGLKGINPEYLDPALGSSSYNMSTNMQSLASSREIIREAAETKAIKRVLLVIDHEVLSLRRADSRRAEQALWMARARSESFPDNLKTIGSFVTNPVWIKTSASLTFLTPWVYNRSTDLKRNVREKLAGKVLDDTGHRLSNGYEPGEGVVDQSIHFITLREAATWDAEEPDLTFHSLELRQGNEKILQEICEFCKENGIELTAVVVPYPNYLNIYRLTDYAMIRDALTELFDAYGFSYLDFNLTKESAFSLSDTDFQDVGHLNSSGAKKFSRFLGAILKRQEEEEVISDLFYDPWDFTEIN